MKKLNLLGLLVIGACTFQACHSPESRAAKGDSTQTDSSKKDSTTGGGTSADAGKVSDNSSKKDSMPKDVTNQSKVDGDESTFMKKAAVGGMMEVELGQVALKSTNAKVKSFGELMIKDHSKANDELKALATKSGIILPTAYPADEQAHLDMMKKMTGTAFDKHYVAMMVTDHDKTIALFKAGARSQDKGVSDFAKKTLPTIESHYEKAKALQAEMK